MADVVNETQQDFWRPPTPVMSEPVAVPQVIPAMAEACPRCGTEFLLGSKFCHSCGRRRPEAQNATALSDAAEFAGLWENTVAGVQSGMRATVGFIASERIWKRISLPTWLHYLHFHEIKRWVGLPTASLIAFVIGLGCVAGALLVGLITARNLVDWQAIQFYRAEWLLAATASFVAGILLKRPSDGDNQ